VREESVDVVANVSRVLRIRRGGSTVEREGIAKLEDPVV
jgi:hypothetical protein